MRDDYAGRPQHGLPESVAALVDLDDRPGLRAFHGLLGHGLVMLRVKALAVRREALDPDTGQPGDHVGVHQLDAGHELRLDVVARAVTTLRSR